MANVGFHVVGFSFERILTDPDFRRLILESYADTDVGKILIESPDLFCMHKKKEPKEGVFFIKLIAMPRGAKDKLVRISADASRVFSDFYPRDRILIVVVTGNGNSPLLVSWLGKSAEIRISKMKPLEKFIETDLQIKSDNQLLTTLNNELVKMYGQ